MFLKSSRYHKVATETALDAKGRSVQALKLRRLADVEKTEEISVTNALQLDVMAKRSFSDSTKFWYIADANTELEANALVEKIGETVKQPSN